MKKDFSLNVSDDLLYKNMKPKLVTDAVNVNVNAGFNKWKSILRKRKE